MISKDDKKIIVGVLGSHYSIQIIKHLEDNGFKPKRAPAFTANLIQQIMNSHHQDEEIEFEILSLVNAKKKQLDKMAKKKKDLLK